VSDTDSEYYSLDADDAPEKIFLSEPPISLRFFLTRTHFSSLNSKVTQIFPFPSELSKEVAVTIPLTCCHMFRTTTRRYSKFSLIRVTSA
jgi:hypothetical protein